LFQQRHHEPPEVTSAEPLPELTDPDVVPAELLLVLELPVDALLVLVVALSLAWATLTPIAIVETTPATTRPDVTTTVWRRALTRWFIGFSSARWVNPQAFNWESPAGSLDVGCESKSVQIRVTSTATFSELEDPSVKITPFSGGTSE
jgi:8-oxo-dGTP pyrophosphatase MutT (NUDIX family)